MKRLNSAQSIVASSTSYLAFADSSLSPSVIMKSSTQKSVIEGREAGSGDCDPRSSILDHRPSTIDHRPSTFVTLLVASLRAVLPSQRRRLEDILHILDLINPYSKGL